MASEAAGNTAGVALDDIPLSPREAQDAASTADRQTRESGCSLAGTARAVVHNTCIGLFSCLFAAAALPSLGLYYLMYSLVYLYAAGTAKLRAGQG